MITLKLTRRQAEELLTVANLGTCELGAAASNGNFDLLCYTDSVKYYIPLNAAISKLRDALSSKPSTRRRREPPK